MNTKKPLIFVVEDDAAFNKLVSNYITLKKDYQIYSFLSGEDCLAKLHLKPDIILMDYELPFRTGIEVMKEIVKTLPNVVIIFLSGQTNIKVAVETLKEGAFDYIVKDTHAKENALHKIEQAIRMKKLEKDQQSYKVIIGILVGVIIVSWVLLFLYYLLIK